MCQRSLPVKLLIRGSSFHGFLSKHSRDFYWGGRWGWGKGRERLPGERDTMPGWCALELALISLGSWICVDIFLNKSLNPEKIIKI